MTCVEKYENVKTDIKVVSAIFKNVKLQFKNCSLTGHLFNKLLAASLTRG